MGFANVLSLGVLMSVVGGAPPAAFQGTQQPLPAAVRAEMTGVSWRPGCPVALDALRLLTISHWGYDGAVKQGELVVHADVADEVLAIFADLFAAKFPIERMQRIEAFGGDDDASMAANNTSAFNCRPITGGRAFSRHSHGKAIDLNPVQNPFVKGDKVSPPAGRHHLSRAPAPGLILWGDACHRAFTRRGWQWGGAWRTLKDYQHFERR